MLTEEVGVNDHQTLPRFHNAPCLTRCPEGAGAGGRVGGGGVGEVGGTQIGCHASKEEGGAGGGGGGVMAPI